MRTFSNLAILGVLGLCACTPVEVDGGLTEAYQGGLVQQAQLDGLPIAGAEAAILAEQAKAAAVLAKAAAAEAAVQAEEAAHQAELAAAETTAAAAAQALVPEEAAGTARAEAAAAAVGAEVVLVGETPAGEAADGNGELAVSEATPADAAVTELGELAGTGAAPESEETPIVVPPGDPEATPIAAPRGAIVDLVPEPASALEVLPAAPESDAGALAALARSAQRPAPPAPDYTALAAANSAPCSPAGFDATPLTSLTLVQTWVDGTASRALLEGPKGEHRTVVQGAVVGPSGARVASIGAGEVVFAEIRFGMDDKPLIVQQRLRVAGPE